MYVPSLFPRQSPPDVSTRPPLLSRGTRLHVGCVAAVVAAMTAVAGCDKDEKKGEAPATTPSAAAVSTSPPPMASVAAPADVAAPPADAERTPNGVAMKVLEPGTGTARPEADRLVTLSYVGWRKDGVMFDQSPPVTLMYRQLTPGWAEGVGHMVEGEKRRLWIPAALAFGDDPKPGQPKGDLTIDVKVVKVGRKVQGEQPLAAMPAPVDVAAPPKDAKKTKSGLSYRVLTSAKGAKPKATDSVVVQYTGWTPDGKMFDSSVARGKAATFALDHVIPGWTEGVQLLHVGEKARFWIPADLAYGEKASRPGAPSGPLVFDIELVRIAPGETGATAKNTVGAVQK